MARTYKRDSRGRFAGGGGSGTPTAKAAVARSAPKTTTARGRARTAETRARAALRAGGGTRAARSLAVAQRARDWYKATGSGTKRSKTRPRMTPASNIRRTGGLRRTAPASNIRRTTGPRRAPLGRKSNAIRTYVPKTARGQVGQMNRQIDRLGKQIKSTNNKLKEGSSKLSTARRRLDRGTARDIADAGKPGLTGELARLSLTFASGRMLRNAQSIIRQRAARAAAAASRGSKPAAKAMGIYDRQLVPVLPGKPGKRAGNTIKPGPRNANPPKSKPRKPRAPKPPSTPKPKPKRKR